MRIWAGSPQAAHGAPTPPLLLLVGGAPASGKSTLAERLAADLAIPLFSKDFFKEALFDTIGAPTREQSRALSGVAYDLLYRVAARLLASGSGVALESNFVRGRSEADLAPLLTRARPVLVHCVAQRDRIVWRYHQRAIGGVRHPGHHDAIALPGVLAALDAGVYAPLAIACPLIEVNTEEGYDPPYAMIIERIHAASSH